MTVGIPDDMRRTAFVSLVGHLVLLAVLTAVPVFKALSPGAVSYQVTLVSPAPRPAAPQVPAAPSIPEPAPKPIERLHTPPAKAFFPEPPATPRATPAPPAKPAPAAPLVPLKARERLSDSFKDTLQKVVLPTEVMPPAPTSGAMKSSPNIPVAKAVTQSPKNTSQADLNEMLRKADESLSKPPVVPVAKSAVPTQPSKTAPMMNEDPDIAKLLNRLPVTVPSASKPAVSPVAPFEGNTRSSKDRLPTPTAAVSGSAAVSREVTVERCPPKAQKYCPILEAAINRAWNADTNPNVRQVLESAGSATVRVRIVIQPNGEIREIRINAPSGNEPYDRAVQSVLREIRTLPPLPDEMKGEPFVAVTSFTYAKKQDS